LYFYFTVGDNTNSELIAAALVSWQETGEAVNAGCMPIGETTL